MRGRLLAWIGLFGAGVFGAALGGTTPAQTPPGVEVTLLAPGAAAQSDADIVSGVLDAEFAPLEASGKRAAGSVSWLRLRAAEDFRPAGVPVLLARLSRGFELRLYAKSTEGPRLLSAAVSEPRFRGARQDVFLLPGPLRRGEALYARIATPVDRSLEDVRFSWSTLEHALAAKASRSRVIVFAFGAMTAMSLAALLIWLMLSERLVLLYASMFSLQALYVAYVSGQGFDWPVLRLGAGLMPYAWNVPAALGGTIACLFAREIADLRRFSPRVYRVFGALAIAFLVLAAANVAQMIGFGWLVAAIGNLLFTATAAFTLIVAFIAWRRGSRPAGWFLLAWGLLETITIATATRLLLVRGDDADLYLYNALPLSMVAAAVLVALGVADQLREQRLALSDAERRAQTDPLTGVLNRGSLIERLEAACVRAQARGIAIAVLFIDVDHFKRINDSFGHPAGDACLKALIGAIQPELRQSDAIGRYGGEEFVVVLSSAGASAAEPIAERIVRRVAELRVEGYGTPIRLTCSIGIAASDTLGVWGERLIAHADAAVYAAKSSGRNRVQLAASLAA